MKLICKDGSLSGGLITVLLTLGTIIFFGGMAWAENYYLRATSFCLGVVLVASAGYAGRAKALGLRSFGKSEWESARSSYKNAQESH